MGKTEEKKPQKKKVLVEGKEVLLDVSPEICAKVCEEYGFPALAPGKQLTLQCNCGCQRKVEAIFLGAGEDPDCSGCPISEIELCFDNILEDKHVIKFTGRGQVSIVDVS